MKKLVLVIDDDKLALKLAGQACHDLGYKVHVADDAIEAVKELTARRFDLILLDHNINDVYGYEIIDEIAAYIQHATVCVFTGDKSQATRRAYAERQISNFIYKPLSKSAIGMKAMQLIGQ